MVSKVERCRMLNIVKRFKSQIANLGIYFFASLIPMVLSLASNPFFAKNMSPTDYAITGYYSAFSPLFLSLINFCLIHYYIKRFYELDEEGRRELKATLFKSLIFFSAIMSLCCLGLLFVYADIINSDSEIPFWPYAALSIFTTSLSGIYSLTLSDYKMRRTSKKFFVLSVTNGVVGVMLAVLLVVVLKLGAFGRMVATFVTTLAMFIYLVYKNREVWHSPFSKGVFISALKFCSPLVAANMLEFFCNGYDKVLLERMGDVTTLGIYSVGVSIAAYLSVFSTSINDTFQPDVFEGIVKRNYGRVIKIIALKLLMLIIIVGLFAVFAPFIIKVLTFGRYVNATPYAIIVALSTITSMLFYSANQITIALGLTKVALINKIIGTLICIGSYYLLISNYGAIGAAWGNVLSFVYFFVGNLLLIFIFRKKIKPVG